MNFPLIKFSLVRGQTIPTCGNILCIIGDVGLWRLLDCRSRSRGCWIMEDVRLYGGCQIMVHVNCHYFYNAFISMVYTE